MLNSVQKFRIFLYQVIKKENINKQNFVSFFIDYNIWKKSEEGIMYILDLKALNTQIGRKTEKQQTDRRTTDRQMERETDTQ